MHAFKMTTMTQTTNCSNIFGHADTTIDIYVVLPELSSRLHLFHSRARTLVFVRFLVLCRTLHPSHDLRSSLSHSSTLAARRCLISPTSTGGSTTVTGSDLCIRRLLLAGAYAFWSVVMVETRPFKLAPSLVGAIPGTKGTALGT